MSMDLKNIEDPEIKKEIIENNLQNQFSICCSNRKTDRRVLQYTAQCVVSFSVLILCAIQVIRGAKNEELTVYISLIASICGYFLPNPSIK
jgi:hypothetical protein